MNDQSPKSPRKTSKASPNTISSQGSGAGRWPLNSPDGRRMRQCVREVRRASLLVWLENEAGGTTPVTWLRPFSTSSQSCDLQLFLANRLAQQLKNCGSMLYSLSWKTKATPAHRQYCQRAASAPRTKEIAFSLALSTWPTPTASDWKGGYAGGRIRNGKLSVDRLDVAAQLATGPTVTTIDNNQVRGEAGAAGHPDRSTTLGGSSCQLPDTADSTGFAGIEGAATGELQEGYGDVYACSGLPDQDHGFWSDADWLGCRDGKFRPVEPGTQPLVNGVPTRVVRLRGYGNAIAPQVGAQFIRNFMVGTVDFLENV